MTTHFPKHPLIERLVVGETDFELTYVIKVPRNAKLVVDHQMGEVHIDEVLGDIQATDHMGEITVHLPEDGKYAIDARSKLGSVVSDFPGHQHEETLWLGSRFMADQSSGQKLRLRMGTGDIIILKERKPLPPAPLAP